MGNRRIHRGPDKALAFGALIAVFLLAALAGCGGGGSSSSDAGSEGSEGSEAVETAASSESGSESSGGTITVGADIALTGPLAENGALVKKAYEFAIDKVNAEGGAAGHQLKLVVEDDKGEASVAGIAVKKLITSDGAEVILGTYGSDPALASSEVAEQYEIPNIQPFASASEVVERGYKFLFNTFPLADQEEEASTAFLNEEVKPKTAAIIHIAGPYGETSANTQREKLEEGGTKIVLDEEIELSESDYSTVVQKLKESKPEAVMMTIYAPEEIVIMKEMRQFDVSPKVVYLNSSISLEPQSLEALGETGDWIMSTPEWFPGSPMPGAEKVIKEYEAKVGSSATIETFKGIQAVEILAHGIEEAGGAEPEALREALSSISNFEAMGVPIEFDSRGQNSAAGVMVAQLQNMKGVALAPADKKQGAWKPFPAWNER